MKKKNLYLECYSGISGDMLVGALLDLGASLEHLREELAKLPFDGYELIRRQEQKCGIGCCAFRVKLTEQEEHAQGHSHEHSHEHRHYRDIRAMIENSGLSAGVKEKALAMFQVLAAAEGKVHGKPVEQVAFHEVGAVDSIVDIVGIAICLEELGIEKIYTSEIYEGQGHTWCQHGKIPVPVPAVLELSIKYQLPLKITNVQGEMVTPTGAAAVAALAERSGSFAGQKMVRLGMGCGEKEFPHANILRAVLLEEEAEEPEKEQVWVLETNVDDCTGEQIGYAIDCLLREGARDACAMPLYMKKNRPAFLLQVICDEDRIPELENLIFRETTSIGLRKYRTERTVLERKTVSRSTPYGQIRVKVCTHGQAVYQYPEYEDLKAVCEREQLPFPEVYQRVTECLREEN